MQLVGISSGVLQQVAYFGKAAHALHRPACVLADENSAFEPSLYQQIRFQDFLAPDFWHAVLTPERTAPRIGRIPSFPPNHFRELLDQWWDYSKYMLWERSL